MVSRTKYNISDEKIREIFTSHGIGGIKSITPLGAGEFNSVFEVIADKPYVLKVAPDNAGVLTYEKDMMKSEVFWYKTLREKTDISTPEVYFEDFSGKIIPVNYFVMEKVVGTQKDKTEFADKNRANDEIVKMVAEMHRVKGESFGYIQTGLFDNWYDAYRHILSGLLSDLKRAGKHSKRGERLFSLTEKYKTELMSAEPYLVNFDCWDPNFICTDKENYKFTWIDPERNLWGDRLLDFGCLDTLTPLESKTRVLEVYNSAAVEPVTVGENEKIRYGFAWGLMGLIMETEKYYRYTPRHFGWWRNVGGSYVYYRGAFGVLGK